MSRAYMPPYDYAVRNENGREVCIPSRAAHRRSTHKRKKFLRVFCITFVLLLAFAIYFQTNVTTVLISVSEATMRSSAIEAINDAVYKTLGDHPSYEDLVSIERDDEGNIAAISANALKINKIARDTASLSQKYLRETGESGVKIPVGALTGIKALSGVWKKINIDILPVCSVICSFSSGFESVGINQTKHSIYLNVIADISIVMASSTDNFAVQTDVLAGECVLVGKIPDTYLQTGLLGKTATA